jgi:biopolymer transport protein ExbB
MTSLFLLAQATQTEIGWLSRKLLGVTLTSAEWVLWLLIVLSVLSIALMLERAVYFATHRLPDSESLLLKLTRGEFDAVRTAVQGKKGMEAAVIREARCAARARA